MNFYYTYLHQSSRKGAKINFNLLYLRYSSPNPMFDHLLESSRRDDSNKWSNIGLNEEIGIVGIKICTLSGTLIYMYTSPVYKCDKWIVLTNKVGQELYTHL